MNIALDFDDTYTRDPPLWDIFITHAKDRDHDIRIVTFRKHTMSDPALDWLGQTIPVIFTEGEQKRIFTNKMGWLVDIWIDDSPEFIVDLIQIVEYDKDNEANKCRSGNPNSMCKDCNCWKYTRHMCS